MTVTDTTNVAMISPEEKIRAECRCDGHLNGYHVEATADLFCFGPEDRIRNTEWKGHYTQMLQKKHLGLYEVMKLLFTSTEAKVHRIFVLTGSQTS